MKNWFKNSRIRNSIFLLKGISVCLVTLCCSIFFAAHESYPNTELTKTEFLEAQQSTEVVPALEENNPTPSPFKESATTIDFMQSQSTLWPATNAPVDRHLKSPLNAIVSEKCTSAETLGGGITTCIRSFSNGHYLKTITQLSNEGDEVKQQTTTEEYNGSDRLLDTKTIRHRIDYNYFHDRQTKEKELFDIIDQPAGEKATRELMVYQYYLDTGKLRSLSWTLYKQIGNLQKAGLNFYAMLRYGEDGSPERGIVEQWAEGHKITSFMNWNRVQNGYTDLDFSYWNHWENLMRSISIEANFS